MSKYNITYINSADKQAYIEIEANNKDEAKKLAKKQLGRECYRIVSTKLEEKLFLNDLHEAFVLEEEYSSEADRRSVSVKLNESVSADRKRKAVKHSFKSLKEGLQFFDRKEFDENCRCFELEMLYESMKNQLTNQDKKRLSDFIRTAKDADEVNTYMAGLLNKEDDLNESATPSEDEVTRATDKAEKQYGKVKYKSHNADKLYFLNDNNDEVSVNREQIEEELKKLPRNTYIYVEGKSGVQRFKKIDEANNYRATFSFSNNGVTAKTTSLDYRIKMALDRNWYVGTKPLREEYLKEDASRSKYRVFVEDIEWVETDKEDLPDSCIVEVDSSRATLDNDIQDKLAENYDATANTFNYKITGVVNESLTEAVHSEYDSMYNTAKDIIQGNGFDTGIVNFHIAGDTVEIELEGGKTFELNYYDNDFSDNFYTFLSQHCDRIDDDLDETLKLTESDDIWEEADWSFLEAVLSPEAFDVLDEVTSSNMSQVYTNNEGQYKYNDDYDEYIFDSLEDLENSLQYDIEQGSKLDEEIEGDSLEARLNNVKMMHEVMQSMNNEDAYCSWIYTMPDCPDESDFEWFAEDGDEYKYLVDTFNRIYNKYKKDGLYKPSEKALDFLKHSGYSDIEVLESLNI